VAPGLGRAHETTQCRGGGRHVAHTGALRGGDEPGVRCESVVVRDRGRLVEHFVGERIVHRLSLREATHSTRASRAGCAAFAFAWFTIMTVTHHRPRVSST